MTERRKPIVPEPDAAVAVPAAETEDEAARRYHREYWLGKNPTPEERGDAVVMRLENFIREGRTERGGIPFRRWQELARFEVANAIRDAERRWRGDDKFVTRGLLVGAVALVTAGVWGTLLAAEAAPDRQTAALILLVAGATLLAVLGAWGVRRLDRFYQLARRRDHFTRVRDFDRQLATLDKDLERRLRELEAALEQATTGKLGNL
jgi:hypothetical protein